jgi:hypothetical protein
MKTAKQENSKSRWQILLFELKMEAIWPLIGILHQPWMIDEYGASVGIRTGRGNRSTWRKPAPVPLFPLQIPHDLTWDQTAVGSQQLIT